MACNQRSRAPCLRTHFTDGCLKFFQYKRVAEIESLCIVAMRIHVTRKRNARIVQWSGGGEHVAGIHDDTFDGCLVVGDAIDEGTVGAVLQQSSYEIRQQFFVAAYRRIDAAWYASVG